MHPSLIVCSVCVFLFIVPLDRLHIAYIGFSSNAGWEKSMLRAKLTGTFLWSGVWDFCKRSNYWRKGLNFYTDFFFFFLNSSNSRLNINPGNGRRLGSFYHQHSRCVQKVDRVRSSKRHGIPLGSDGGSGL